MHNNGTNRIAPRLILPDRGPILSTLPQPRQGIELEIRPDAIVAKVTDGMAKLELALDAQTATQLGVNLIAAGSLLGSGLIPQAPQIAAEPTTDH